MTAENYPVEDWLLKLPLYSPVELGDDIYSAIEAIELFGETMDAFCPSCQQNATFASTISTSAENIKQEEQRNIQRRQLGVYSQSAWKIPNFMKAIVCTRAGHIVHFYFIHDENSIIKIGQYPSLADMATGDTSQFIKALGKERLHELNKAIGLAAHGVGIGAYVYLRRVFESLIEDAHQKAKLGQGWNEEGYQPARMKERVAMLKSWLPSFIVEHPQLYGILSLGVHELTEGECLKNFEALKSAILVIAEEKMHEIQREARYRDASQAIDSVSRTT
jgi:hypothetical protein